MVQIQDDIVFTVKKVCSRYLRLRDHFLQDQVTITFGAQNGRTRLTLLYKRTPPAGMIEPMTAGWNQSFDKPSVVLKAENVRSPD